VFQGKACRDDAGEPAGSKVNLLEQDIRTAALADGQGADNLQAALESVIPADTGKRSEGAAHAGDEGVRDED
jgi:hypothetical protein